MGYHIDLLDDLVNGNATDDLIKIKENFLELNGSRIVEHNLDVSNPENGYYIRWENGLQVCIVKHLISINTNSVQYKHFPVSFISGSDYVPFLGLEFYPETYETSYRDWWDNIHKVTVNVQDSDQWRVLYRGNTINITGYIYLGAIGRWK